MVHETAPYVPQGLNFPDDLPPVFWPPGLKLDFLVPIIVANSFSYILTGALVSQFSYYLRRYRKDPTSTKLIVWSLFLANIIHAALQISRDVSVLGKGFGDWRSLSDYKNRPQETMIPIFSTLIIGACQTVLATRSFLFCRSLAMGAHLSRTEVGGSIAKAILIVGSVTCGLGSIVAMSRYPDLFALGNDNQKALFGKKAYPLFEMMWLLLGTLADIWIAASMWSDAKKAKTGYRTSSDSILQVLINVALRCGLSLAIVQTGIQILYFAHALTWADAAHSVLPRIASLAVIYSLASPKEAYRAQQRHEGRLREGLPTPASSNHRNNSLSPPTSTSGRARTTTSEKKPRKGVSFLRRKQMGHQAGMGTVPEEKRDLRTEEEGRVERAGWVDEVGAGTGTGLGSMEKGGDVSVSEEGWTSGGSITGGGGRPLELTIGGRAVNVQTTSSIRVETVTEDEETGVRLGNTVVIQGPTRPRSTSHRSLNHPFRSPRASSHRPLPSPTHEPPNFIDSFPSRATVTSSTGVFDPDENEYDLPPIDP